MTITVTKQVILDVRENWCGHWVALPMIRWKELEQTGENFWCPFGHITIYRENENKVLRACLAKAQELATSAQEHEANALKMLDAERNATKRLLKRVNVGVCPHCHRTFQQLARHMASKHQRKPSAIEEGQTHGL